jgi:hypothetical protein
MSEHDHDRHVTLRVVAPSWCTSMTFPRGEDGTLMVSRHGTLVPADVAQDFINIAAKHGVTLTAGD